MARRHEEIIEILGELYEAEFGGKENQRFLISWADLRSLYGLSRLFPSRVKRLTEQAIESDLYVLDLGEGEHDHFVAVVKVKTVDRWRRVPKKLIAQYTPDEVDEGTADTDDDD